MFGLMLAGLLGKGMHSIYKDAKYEAQAQAAGHRLLVGCKTPGEVIRAKCVSSDPDMPQLTEDELRTIEGWYKNGGANREIQMAYLRQTGNLLIDVIKRR